MRLCRFKHQDRTQVGLYDDKFITPLAKIAEPWAGRLESIDLLDYLPPDGKHFATAKKAADFAATIDGSPQAAVRLAHDAVELLVPIPRPNKLLLLAGNYNEHLTEGGGAGTERAETFPYVFWKPPTTTLVDPNKPVVIPRVSPDHIDWELELCIVMGRRARHVKEADALEYVAGYTVANDISDRQFRPNPGRKARGN